MSSRDEKQFERHRVHESTCSWLAFGPCDGDQCYWAIWKEGSGYEKLGNS